MHIITNAGGGTTTTFRVIVHIIYSRNPPDWPDFYHEWFTIATLGFVNVNHVKYVI